MSQACSNYDAVQEAIGRAEEAFAGAASQTATFVRRVDKSIDPIDATAQQIVQAIAAPGGLSDSTKAVAIEDFVRGHVIHNSDGSTEVQMRSGDSFIAVGKPALQMV